MPSAQVHSYTAHIGRLGPLGTDRLIVLTHNLVGGTSGGDRATSEIYFSDRFGESNDGFNTMGEADTVRAHLPADDFPLWLDLLRNEDPVFVHWTESEQAGTPEGDGIIHLATGPEPTGEGPADFTPYPV